MESFTKSERKALGRLAGEAYDAELGYHLDLLFREFEKWKADEISPFDLSDLIHEFHDGESRRLWSLYNHQKPDFLVPRAVGFNFLKEEDLPEKLRETFKTQIESFRAKLRAEEDE